jgi:hypothetical protein
MDEFPTRRIDPIEEGIRLDDGQHLRQPDQGQRIADLIKAREKAQYGPMPFNGAPQPGKGQPNMQDYLKQFDQGQADISGLEDLFGRMRGNMQMQGLLGSLNKGF